MSTAHLPKVPTESLDGDGPLHSTLVGGIARYLARQPDRPHFSVIIPAYSAANIVHPAIESAMV